MYDGYQQAILCHVGGKKNKNKNCLSILVGGKKKIVEKVDHVIENLKHF